MKMLPEEFTNGRSIPTKMKNSRPRDRRNPRLSQNKSKQPQVSRQKAMTLYGQ
jgi:hypothetical protein